MKLLMTVDEGKNEWAPWVKCGDTVWYCLLKDFSEKEIPKGAGFSFHGRKGDDGQWTGKKVWWTKDKDKAAKLARYADQLSDWGKELNGLQVHLTASLAGSRKASTDVEFPHPEDLAYMPFQKAGIEYMLDRQNTLLADEMGLGKTIQAIGLINSDSTIKTVLVICPATLKLNWKQELQKWLVRSNKVEIATTKDVPLPVTGNSAPANGVQVTITHYEAVSKINDKLSAIDWDLMVIDEAHYIKNTNTIRYRGIMGGTTKKNSEKTYSMIPAKRRIFATGTPICNNPTELWPLISAVDPGRWNKETFWYYHKRYCNVQNSGYGMDFKGAGSADRLEELQKKLRETVLIRRLKKDVLTELPPKIRQVIELEYDANDSAVRQALSRERDYENAYNTDEEMIEMQARAELAKASDNAEEYKSAIEAITHNSRYKFEEMARIRHETAVAKIPYAIEYVKEQIEIVGKAVVFAHHHEVIEAFAKEWPLESVSIYGETKIEDRQGLVHRFQDDPNIKLALVSIKAGGVGLTLTAASHEYFVELDWVPGNVTQAEDRCHRIGQRDTVNVYHLVLADSLDVHMAKTIIRKQTIIDHALDNITERDPVAPTRDNAATKNTTKKQVEEEANNLDISLIPIIHEALEYIAAHDSDQARYINGVGFNKIDGKIGHSLANCVELTPKQAVLGRKLVRKYRKQIPGFYERIFGKIAEDKLTD